MLSPLPLSVSLNLSLSFSQSLSLPLLEVDPIRKEKAARKIRENRYDTTTFKDVFMQHLVVKGFGRQHECAHFANSLVRVVQQNCQSNSQTPPNNQSTPQHRSTLHSPPLFSFEYKSQQTNKQRLLFGAGSTASKAPSLSHAFDNNNNQTTGSIELATAATKQQPRKGGSKTREFDSLFSEQPSL